MMDKSEIEKTISLCCSLPIFKMQPPKDIVVFDGVLHGLRDPRYVIGRVYYNYDVMFLTELSDVNTIVHEMLHLNGVYNENLTRALARFFERRIKNSIWARVNTKHIRYRECEECEKDPTPILNQFGVRPEFEGKPKLRHYILIYE